MSLPTPLTNPLHASIYPPSEDTYLLLDTLHSDAPYLHSRFPPSTPPPLVLELGPGSGTVTAFITTHAATLFGRNDVLTLGVDANAHACAATGDTVALNRAGGGGGGLFLGALTGDLATPLRDGTVDVLVFNPPYVPSDTVPSLLPPGSAEGGGEESERDRENRLLALTYDGGVDGMEVTWRVLEVLGEVLAERGVAYVVFCAQNRPEVVLGEWKRREEEGGEGEGEGEWEVERVGSSGKRGGVERLGVWRIAR
ncbi:hypothetical protein EDC01DRAFT_696905, partial [Geopyxis carbonaria]